MRRFRFRFQRLLEIKERMEERRRAELGEAVAVLNQERDRLAELRRIQQFYRQGPKSLPDAPLDPSLLALNASYDQRLRRETQEQLDRIRQVEEAVEKRRQKLVDATKERRVYEILKERAVEAYQHERRRQEQMVLDEIGGQLYIRREDRNAVLNP